MKEIRINESSTNLETIEINKQHFFKIENINTYNYDDNDLQTWILSVNDSIHRSNELEINEYFIIDTLFHEAFSHWVYESCIYINSFLELKKNKPNLKLHLVEAKSYKKLFCNFFGIKESDILYEFPLKEPNICYLPKYSKLTPRHQTDDKYLHSLQGLFDFFSNYKTENKNQVDICLLPRQKKENFKNNDRNVSVDKIYQYLHKNKSYKYDVLETDMIQDLKEQIERVRSAKFVILCDGAAYSVNGMFCKNQTILVLGKFSRDQEKNHSRGKAITTKIAENNIVHYFDNEDEIINYLKVLDL